MLLSVQQEFSDSQNVTGTGSTPSTNVIDLLSTDTVLGAPAALVRDIGKGKPIPIFVRLESDAGGTSPTISVQVQMDTTDAFGSPTTVASSETYTDSLAGDEIYLDVYLPEGITEQFMRLNYVLGGTSPDYTLNAGVVVHKSSNATVPGA